jgi:hypothetical protein
MGSRLAICSSVNGAFELSESEEEPKKKSETNSGEE